MGIQIKVKNVDYSGLGLGNVNLSETYIATAGAMPEKNKTAVRTFYNTIKSAGLMPKLDVLRLFHVGTSLADSINLINPVLGSAAYQATYLNDSGAYHTTGGWKPSQANSHAANSNYSLTGRDLSVFHIHAFTTTPENATAGVKTLLGCQANGADGNFFIGLQRNNSGKTAGSIDAYTGNVKIQVNNGFGQPGMLSFARNGADRRMWVDKTLAGSDTSNRTPTLTGPYQMYEGCLAPVTATTITDCTFRCIAWGNTAWTEADEIALYDAIVAFNTAIA